VWFLISPRRGTGNVSGLSESLILSSHPASRSKYQRANPSRWGARLPIAVLVAFGLGIASYLAAYQFGFVNDVWEPLFRDGSRRVLHSFISTLLPLPDAAVGAAAYAIELLATLAGGGDRSRTRPRLVLFYGGIVAALAAGGLILSAVQAFVIRAGCTLCLSSAAISVIIAVLARDEIVAGIRQLKRKHS